MNNFRINFYIIGIDDEAIESLDINEIDLMRRGDICNKRTGKKYTENSVKKTYYTQYEDGFGPATDRMIRFINDNSIILDLIKVAKGVSLQVCVDLDDDCKVPHIGFTLNQLKYLVKIGAEIEVHIS